ncbi:MAG: T9SS type A sorting domain-containing protein [Bacteroidia bacterium]|nr:T9SS type A sorting domain-containing protein [Bacteroidia bacterium]
MKKTVITLATMALTLTLDAQWNGATNPINTTYSVGIGTTTPDQKLEVETSTPEDGIMIKQTYQGGAGLHLINTYNGGNHWGLYSLNNDNTPAGGHFIIYDHTNSEYRFMIDETDGNIGIGTIYPDYKLHLSTDDANMTNNPIGSSTIYMEPSHWGGYFEYQGTNALGINASLMGYNLNNKASTGGNLTEGIGICGKAQRTASSSGNTQCTGVKGFATGAAVNIGGVFVGGSSNYIGGRFLGSEQSRLEFNLGLYSTAFGKGSLASYFNGGTFSNTFYQCAESGFMNETGKINNPIAILKELKPIKFTYNSESNSSLNLPVDIQFGLSVAELEKSLPSLVFDVVNLGSEGSKTNAKGTTTFKAINYINLIPILIASIQEQQIKIDSFETEFNELKKLVQLQNESLTRLKNLPSGNNLIDQIQNKFYLEQNVPNPFKDETEIRYLVPTEYSQADLLISDLTGKSLFTIRLQTGVESSVRISSEKLNAGIYYYTMVSNGKVLISKQMIVSH